MRMNHRLPYKTIHCTTWPNLCSSWPNYGH